MDGTRDLHDNELEAVIDDQLAAGDAVKPRVSADASHYEWAIKRAGEMWDCGKNTLDIAKALNLAEPQALWYVRQHLSARRA